LKNKKALGIVAVVGACFLLVFSIFIFPFILAASPEERELERVEVDSAYPAEELEQNDLTEVPLQQEESGQAQSIVGMIDASEIIDTSEIDINAITEEMALAIALDYIPVGEETVKSPVGAHHTTSLELRGARYIESIDHIDAPIWRVLFYAFDYGESFVYIDGSEHLEDNEILEQEFSYRMGDFCCYTGSMGEDNSGKRVIVTSYSYECLYFIDIDAFTGELVGQGLTGMCDHEGNKRELSYDLNTDWEMLPENMHHWTLTPEKVPRELNYSKQRFGTTWDVLIRVPDLVGSTLTEVVAVFSEIELLLDISTVDSSSPADTVVFISDVGEIVPRDTTIYIHVSNGITPVVPTPEPTPIPIP